MKIHFHACLYKVQMDTNIRFQIICGNMQEMFIKNHYWLWVLKLKGRLMKQGVMTPDFFEVMYFQSDFK